MRECVQGVLQEFGSQQRLELASQFVNIGVGLASQPPSPVLRATRANNDVPKEDDEVAESATIVATEEEEFNRVLRHPLKCRHEPGTATAVYEEYYGLGEFQGKPIEGGLKGLEDKYQTRWRRGDTAYQKAFSRMKQLVSFVDSRMKEQSKEKEEVLEELD